MKIENEYEKGVDSGYNIPVSAWTVSILPRFEIRTESGQVVSLRSRQYAEFLTILALAGPRGVELTSIGSDFFSEEWSDHKKALRNLISRTKKFLEPYSHAELITRDAEFVSLIPEACDCDLWNLRDELDRPSQTANLDRIEQLLRTVRSPLVGGQFISMIASELLSACAEDMLRGLELLSNQPSRPGLRSLAGTVLGAIKPLIQFSTDLTQRQLAIFGRLRMRQEIIETLADYSDFLSEDLGDSPDRQLEKFAETLLFEIDRSETDPFVVPKLSHYYLPGIAPVEELVGAVLSNDSVFVGGLPGVGKSQLLIEAASSLQLRQLNPAFVDLKELTRPVPLSSLVARSPSLIIVDHYSHDDAEIIASIKALNLEAKLVIAGTTDQGLLVQDRITVKPLSMGTIDDPGQADSLVKHLLNTRVHTPLAICKLAQVCQGIPSAIVRIVKLVEEFGAELAIHSFTQERTFGGQDIFNQDLLAESLRKLSGASQSLLKALVGLNCPVSTVEVATCFRVGSDELRHLVSLGMLELNREHDTFEVPRALKEQLAQLPNFESGNASQRILENGLFAKLQNQAPANSKRHDIIALQLAIESRSSHGDFSAALNMLCAVRPHLFQTRNCICGVDGLADELFALDLPADQCLETLLAIGTGLFYQFRYADIVNLLEEPRWNSKKLVASPKQRAELDSQLGIAKATAGDKWAGIKCLESAVSIASEPGLESILVKILYNLAVTYFRVREFDLLIQIMERAVSMLKFVPTPTGRLELLHMMALYSDDVGLDPGIVRERFHVALSYAKSNSLDSSVGWIMGSLGTISVRQRAYLPAIVMLTASIRDELAAELTFNFRVRCRFYLDLIAHCLQEVGSTTLAYQAAIMAINVSDNSNSSSEEFDGLGISPIQLPKGLDQASSPVTGGEILVFLARLQHFTRQFPEAHNLYREFGYLDERVSTEPTAL